MNKKYITDSEGKVTVITDTGETIERKDKYTKNTGKILSLENVIESFENKISWFNQELRTLLHRKNSSILGMIIHSLIIVLIMVLSYLFFGNIITPMTIIAGITGIILIPSEIVSLIKNNKKIKKYHQRIRIESHKINKIERKIETLEKDKTPIKDEFVNHFKDVEKIYNYNFDPTDYFIEKYTIESRTKQMNKEKKKVRKLTNADYLNY